MLEDLIKDMINGKDLPDNVAKSLGQKVVDNAKERAEKILEDVDTLIEHIKSEDSPEAK